MKKVVVVDDERIVGLIVSTFLSKLGFQVFTFDNGNEALRFFEKNDVDLIITDLNMPQLNGFDLMSRIRNKPKKKVDIIVMSGVCNTVEDIQRSASLGVKDFILKPFDFDVFSKKISYLSKNNENWNEWKIDGPKAGILESSLELISISEVSLTVRSQFQLNSSQTLKMSFDVLKDYGLGSLFVSVLDSVAEGSYFIIRLKIIGLKEVDAKKIRQLCRAMDHVQIRLRKEYSGSSA